MNKRLLLMSSLVVLTGCATPPADPVVSSNTVPIEQDIIEQTAIEEVNVPTEVLDGSYRCWQFNVDGYGGSCRTLSPVVFAADGTYSISSTSGTYTLNGDTIILSESEYWGPGTLKEDGLQLYFNYTYNGKPYEVTYLRE